MGATLSATGLGDTPSLRPCTAGERRSFTANTIIRDPDWRKKDAEGALRINPDDATSLGVSTGERVWLVTRRAAVTVPVEVSATMHRRHIALPNGLGVAYGEGGATCSCGKERDHLAGGIQWPVV